MAFYFELNGKVYKTPNRVTIGRGSPFDDLLDNRNISRAHCEIVLTKKGFFIKDLDSSSGVIVNGKRIKTNKFVNIKETDSLDIGGYPLQVFKQNKGKEFQKVSRYTSKVAWISQLSFIKITMFLWIAFALLGFLTKGSFDISTIVSFATFFSIFIASIVKLNSFFMGKNDELIVNQVILGESGLTIHYKDTNMSIKFEDIQHVYKNHKKCFVIHAHDDKFVVHLVKNIEKLFDQVIRKAPSNARNTKPKNDLATKKLNQQMTLLFVSFSISAYFIMNNVDIWGRFDLLKLVALLLFVLTSIAFKFPIFSLLENSKTKKRVLRQKIGFAIPILALCYIFYDNYSALKEQKIVVNSCLNQKISSCSEVRFWVINNSDDFSNKYKKKLFTKICKRDNSFCSKAKRSIASENTN